MYQVFVAVYVIHIYILLYRVVFVKLQVLYLIKQWFSRVVFIQWHFHIALGPWHLGKLILLCKCSPRDTSVILGNYCCYWIAGMEGLGCTANFACSLWKRNPLPGCYKGQGPVSVRTYSRFLLFAIVISYKLATNIELANSEPLILQEIEG